MTDAGLGCPDWPGCHGKLSPTHAAAEIRAAEAVAPAGPVSLPVAVAHNGVAALLLAALVMLNFAAYSPSRFR